MLAGLTGRAQFAPQAGMAGSTAVSASSPDIVAWATHCSVQRGYIDIASPSLGLTITGDSTSAVGPANGSIVCLGDSGVATVSCTASLFDGPGPDFAVFENGFKDPANAAMAFLELAFVEVSSDGVNFTRFPAVSNTPANMQIPGSGVYIDAALINNLAGKYVATYGTPFDLAELAGTPGLDVTNITHVRLVDVIGSIAGHSCQDNEGKIIHDPYPTNFPVGGFDLDAVAAMHMNSTGLHVPAQRTLRIYPNPARDVLQISATQTEGTLHILSGIGTILKETQLTAAETALSIAELPAGVYYITITSNSGATQWAGSFVKL